MYLLPDDYAYANTKKNNMQNINKDIYPHISSKQAIGDLNRIIYYNQRVYDNLGQSVEEYMNRLMKMNPKNKINNWKAT